MCSVSSHRWIPWMKTSRMSFIWLSDQWVAISFLDNSPITESITWSPSHSPQVPGCRWTRRGTGESHGWWCSWLHCPQTCWTPSHHVHARKHTSDVTAMGMGLGDGGRKWMDLHPELQVGTSCGDKHWWIHLHPFHWLLNTTLKAFRSLATCYTSGDFGPDQS